MEPPRSSLEDRIQQSQEATLASSSVLAWLVPEFESTYNLKREKSMVTGPRASSLETASKRIPSSGKPYKASTTLKEGEIVPIYLYEIAQYGWDSATTPHENSGTLSGSASVLELPSESRSEACKQLTTLLGQAKRWHGTVSVRVGSARPHGGGNTGEGSLEVPASLGSVMATVEYSPRAGLRLRVTLASVGDDVVSVGAKGGSFEDWWNQWVDSNMANLPTPSEGSPVAILLHCAGGHQGKNSILRVLRLGADLIPEKLMDSWYDAVELWNICESKEKYCEASEPLFDDFVSRHNVRLRLLSMNKLWLYDDCPDENETEYFIGIQLSTPVRVSGAVQT